VRGLVDNHDGIDAKIDPDKFHVWLSQAALEEVGHEAAKKKKAVHFGKVMKDQSLLFFPGCFRT
jgi:hypothetical protein